MPFAKCKVYFDGSHYIAISPTTQKRRGRVGVRAVSEEDEDIVAETKQLGLFDENTADEKRKDGVEGTGTIAEDKAEAGDGTKTPSKREVFECLYKEQINAKAKARKRAIIAGMAPYFRSYEETKLYVEANLRRKRNNLTARRIRMTRKANLQEIQDSFNYFVTLTYDSAIHTEESFKKGLKTCLHNLCKRKGWKYMGVWERSPQKQRLHFHGIFYIPEGKMPGQMIDVNDYNFKSRRRRITHQNTYFNERFGRSDFEEIVDNGVLGEAMAYIMKYIEKSGERIVYSGGLPQFFVSDIMDGDIVCQYGENENKFILSDKFGCWDEGEYRGQVCGEMIAQMPKMN